jgi:hypothetical protein
MSGRVRVQFAKRGWDATSADLLPDESSLWNIPFGPEWGRHYHGDVLDIIEDDWDLVVAHPPCEHLSLAGARYWKEKRADGRQLEAADFFMKMINLPVKSAYVAVENPRGAMTRLYRPPDQVVEPWWFGDPLRKKTCWWLRGKDVPWYKYSDPMDTRDFPSLPLLRADQMVTPDGRVATGGGSWRTDTTSGIIVSGGRRAGGVVPKGSNSYEDSQGRARRTIMRSVTTSGSARAMAEQWGSYIESRRGT